MDKILRVHSVNDYARYIGAPVLHPLVSVIHYDELEHCRHSLNNYDVYGIFIGDETLEELTYGQVNYDLHRHALMCVAPLVQLLWRPHQAVHRRHGLERHPPLRHAACAPAAPERLNHYRGGRPAGLRLSAALQPHVQEVFRHYAQPVPEGQEVLTCHIGKTVFDIC